MSRQKRDNLERLLLAHHAQFGSSGIEPVFRPDVTQITALGAGKLIGVGFLAKDHFRCWALYLWRRRAAEPLSFRRLVPRVPGSLVSRAIFDAAESLDLKALVALGLVPREMALVVQRPHEQVACEVARLGEPWVRAQLAHIEASLPDAPDAELDSPSFSPPALSEFDARRFERQRRHGS